jgi:DNA-binding transcriptional regulator LsrR (DeoR family)
MDEREELLATVASLYYKMDQSQAEIAERLRVSTSKISRMLKEARDRGIVEIHIHMPIPRDLELEHALCATFGLRDALVLQSGADADDDSLLRATGQLAASYLQRVIPGLSTGAMIGVAWGTSVFAAVSAIAENTDLMNDVVQLMGGVGSFTVDSPDIARVLAAKLGGRHYDLHAPVLVEQSAAHDILFGEPAVREGLMRARMVKMAIAGIGAVEDKASSFLRAGLLTRGDLAHLRAEGAVGEMVGRFYKIDGTMDGIEINKRIIGIELDELRRVPVSMAVARGLPKTEAIYGALRGHFISVLATDDVTARGVLARAQENPQSHEPYHITTPGQ